MVGIIWSAYEETNFDSKDLEFWRGIKQETLTAPFVSLRQRQFALICRMCSFVSLKQRHFAFICRMCSFEVWKARLIFL